MGEVWAAQLTGASGFAKEVALKLVPAPDLGSNTVVMFMDEARASSALQHPAVVQTFDLGRDGEHAFIAMEIVRGPSLNILLQKIAKAQRPMTPTLVAYLGERVASALDYAHERAELDGERLKLVHRDVSPQNILLDLGGTVRLSDFGIARTAVQDHLSAVGTMRGKPGYMSPEQARGMAIDDRSDVFCLAIVLWECAAVKRLFGAKDIYDSIAACIERQAPRLTEVLDDFPPELAALIAEALDKDPSKRPKAGAFARRVGELGRARSDWPTVERDLAELIAAVFGEEVFDVDARIRGALDELEAGDHATGAFDQRPLLSDSYRVLGPAAPMPDHLPWPALEPSLAGFEAPSPSPPASLMQLGTSADVRSATRLAAPSNRLGLSLAGLAVFLTAIAATIAIIRQPNGPPVLSSTAAPDPGEPGLTAKAPAVVVGAEQAAQVVADATEPDAGAAPDAAPPSPAAKRHTPRRRKKRKPSPAAAPTPVSDQRPLPARVWRAIGRLQAKDPEAASRFKVIYSEAVASGDAAKLERLNREVQRALHGR